LSEPAYVKKDQFGDAWEGVDSLCADSPDKALELATALLKLGLSDAVPVAQQPTRENILQAGREGWNPGNIRIFSHMNGDTWLHDMANQKPERKC
jgi:hypothetical protein